MIIHNDNAPTINSQLIVSLAKQAQKNLKYYRKIFANYTSSEFRKEFGTVQISMPRHSGHSTAALQIMFEYPDPLLFVSDSSSRDCSRSALADYTTDAEVRNRITRNTLIPTSHNMIQIKSVQNRAFIIIDDARRQPDTIKSISESFTADIILLLQ